MKLYIHVYSKDLPDSTDENIRSILILQVSSCLTITISVATDIIRWYVKLYETEESQMLIRIYSEYLKMER